MSKTKNRGQGATRIGRREVLGSGAMALMGLAASGSAFGDPRQQSMKAAGTDADKTRTSLHQDVEIKASPKRIYEILLDSKQFAACTGLGAEIDPKVGGAFKMFGGQIEGRNVELVPSARIVQAWRPTHWDPGVYSIVRFELKSAGGDATQLALDHTGFPEGEFASLSAGWKAHYWEPMKKFVAG